MRFTNLNRFRGPTLRCLLIGLGIALFAVQLRADQQVSFNRDVRPILTDHCFACHGNDAETVEGGLRLDIAEQAVESAIVPGDANASELVRRILSDDEDELMPPPHLHKPLDATQKRVLQTWINQGAQYQPHWSYTALRRPELPSVKPESQLENPIDRFILAGLQSKGIAPAEQADPLTLIRRLSFDLTGLPPTIEQVDQFVKDYSNEVDAYEAFSQCVDRLMNSDRYGERMAIYWLDLVRYADTVGYHGDQNISQSPYRDYVIKAFNDNMRYDRFVREQLAGDLLPNATRDQLIASGYNRLNQTTEEGGAQPKEYLAIYFADRVRNVSQVFMGATVGCAQCHDHKYDPYTAKDFYSLGAFFADLDEIGKYEARDRPPTLKVPTAQEAVRLAELEKLVACETEALTKIEAKLVAAQATWEAKLKPNLDNEERTETVWVDEALEIESNKSGQWQFVDQANAPVHRGQRSRRQAGDGLIQHFFLGEKAKQAVGNNTSFFAWVFLDPANPPSAIMLQLNDGDWSHRAVWGSDDISYGRVSSDQKSVAYHRMGELPATGDWVRLQVSASDLGLTKQSSINGMAFTQFGGLVHWDEAGMVDIDRVPDDVKSALKTEPGERNPEQNQKIRQYYFKNVPEHSEQSLKLADAVELRDQFESSITTTVISRSIEPREIRILNRGNWMDESGEVVEPAIPEFLGKIESNHLNSEGRASRLDLATWLCRDDNVLTARTMVNRLWYLMFGRGISSSVDDLGGQGTYPTHPELLDFLAVEFIESGWDIQHILKMIATSKTYRRSSKPSPELAAVDPYNETFARQGRFRISAEMVRDATLQTGGLLVQQVGGPSVRPYQPSGYYEQLNFPKRKYVADEGTDQYRRGIYTHWQRTFLHPMLKAFDAPSREECTAFRAQSNTPLQALTLLNDPTFVEAARAFAVRLMTESNGDTQDRIAWAYRQAISRQPDPFIVQQLQQLFEEHVNEFQGDIDAAAAFVSVGQSDVPAELNVAELAAWSSVTRAILNLREMNTRY